MISVVSGKLLSCELTEIVVDVHDLRGPTPYNFLLKYIPSNYYVVWFKGVGPLKSLFIHRHHQIPNGVIRHPFNHERATNASKV